MNKDQDTNKLFDDKQNNTQLNDKDHGLGELAIVAAAYITALVVIIGATEYKESKDTEKKPSLSIENDFDTTATDLDKTSVVTSFYDINSIEYIQNDKHINELLFETVNVNIISNGSYYDDTFAKILNLLEDEGYNANQFINNSEYYNNEIYLTTVPDESLVDINYRISGIQYRSVDFNDDSNQFRDTSVLRYHNKEENKAVIVNYTLGFYSEITEDCVLVDTINLPHYNPVISEEIFDYDEMFEKQNSSTYVYK